MKYTLKKQATDRQEGAAAQGSWKAAFGKMLPLIAEERKGIAVAFVAVILSSVLYLVGPLVVGYVIDTYITAGDYSGVARYSVLLLCIYAVAFAANYVQMRVMGAVAQRMLFRLRNDVFGKLEELPVAFFTQNKAGDLTARISGDTEKLNEFFSQGLMRFAGNFVMTTGAGIFILAINWKLGAAALAPAVLIFIFTKAVAPWTRRKNARKLAAGGALSAEIQESIANFKVILAFNRRDYFKKRFGAANEESFKSAVGASAANELLTPFFELMGNAALLAVLGYGIFLVSAGDIAVGILVSFVMYVLRFYDPLRELSRLWSVFQTAIAAWDRIGEVLHLESDLAVIPADPVSSAPVVPHGAPAIEFRNVSFAYPDGSTVLHAASFAFERGKTYALVGPTGGGKTTTASLIARLYDPTSGTVLLNGRDIRAYDHAERTRKVGFILQDPFLFAGTVRENILYGSDELLGLSPGELESRLRSAGLDALVSRFDRGLDTAVGGSGSLSLGQKQLVAFIRAVLRKPDVLILDEATANVDTVTEQLLEKALGALPEGTTRVIIAHRLNTIENADEIFFVNGGEVRRAGSMGHAVEMLLHGKRKS